MDPLIDLFSCEGRVNRLWYFLHILLDDLVIIGLIIALIAVGGILDTPLFFVPLIGVILGGCWAAIALTVKRLHDLDRPGWHWWLLMVPLYNLYLSLVLLFGRGTVGPNRYGPDPLWNPGVGGYIER